MCPTDRTSCYGSLGRIDGVNTTPSTLIATFGSERLASQAEGDFLLLSLRLLLSLLLSLLLLLLSRNPCSRRILMPEAIVLSPAHRP